MQILLIHFYYVAFFLYFQTVMCHRLSIEYCNTYILKKLDSLGSKEAPRFL